MNKRQRKKLAKRIDLPGMIRRAYRDTLLARIMLSGKVAFTQAEMDALCTRLTSE